MAELLSIILAAGEGTRMRSATPKLLHPVGGLPIIGHVVRAAVGAGSTKVAMITAPEHDHLRAEVAKAHSLPAYVIFHDATLAAIAARAPQSLEDLQGVSGIGASKLEKYGGDVLRVCSEH